MDSDEHWGEETIIANGDAVAWRITVTNTGNLDLADVTVSDALAPACAQTQDLLTVGDTWIYTCTEAEFDAPVTNTASVEATPTPNGFPPVTSSDTAETLEPPELELTKAVDQAQVVVGETLNYELAITNSGVNDAIDVEILDTLPDGLTSVQLPPSSGLTYDAATHTITWSIASVAVGETISVNYSAEVALADTLVNDVAITSDHEENNLDDNSDSASTTATPVPEDPPPLAFTGANSMTMVLWAIFVSGLGLMLLLFARRRKLAIHPKP